MVADEKLVFSRLTVVLLSNGEDVGVEEVDMLMVESTAAADEEILVVADSIAVLAII